LHFLNAECHFVSQVHGAGLFATGIFNPCLTHVAISVALKSYEEDRFCSITGSGCCSRWCVSTVSETHTFALSPGRDTFAGRYNRTLDQVYQASLTVIQRNGVLVTEFIPHDTTNAVRALQGRVNDKNVWIRVEALAPRESEVQVQARSNGIADLDLVHELEKEIALELVR